MDGEIRRVVDFMDGQATVAESYYRKDRARFDAAVERFFGGSLRG